MPPFALMLLKTISVRAALLALAVIVAGGFAWHKIDKAIAVRDAVRGYVKQIELDTALAEIAEIRRRAEVLAIANEHLRTDIAQADADRQAANKRIADYEAHTTPPVDGRVTGDFLKRLRNQ